MSSTHEIVLTGCIPEPLMNYLKALGILRLVSEQVDSNAIGCWRNDVFVLSSTLDKESLIDYFLEKYEPTPILGPWGARSGFYSGSSESSARIALEKILQSNVSRLRDIQNCIRFIQSLLKELNLNEKAEDEEKLELMYKCRSRFPDNMIDWLDTCYILTHEGRKYPPLLGSGGNEGSGSYLSQFAQTIVECVIDRKYDEALVASLFSLIKQNIFLPNLSPGHFSPTSSGGANAGQGFEGSSTTNPWDFIFCLEGSCLWASGTTKRLGTSGPRMAAFPFTFNVTSVGSESLCISDYKKPKEAKRDIAEIWLPIWSKRSTLFELKTLISEGRASIRSRNATSGLDMVKAAASLGLDRGIQLFFRNIFLMRNGQSFMAIPYGKIKVEYKSQVELLFQIDTWLDHFKRDASGKNTPPRFSTVLRLIEKNIFDYCRFGGSERMISILFSLGSAERELALTCGKVGPSKYSVAPLSGLSKEWINATDDGSIEYRLALSIAKIYDPSKELDAIRSNLEPVYFKYQWQWTHEKLPQVVWNSTDLSVNIASVLERRLLDGERKSSKYLPIAASLSAGLPSISAFLAGETNDSQLENFLFGFITIDLRNSDRIPRGQVDTPPIPRAYALLKLMFLPKPLVLDSDRHGNACWRFVKKEESGISIRPEPRILPLLRAGRIGEACRIAYRRLLVSGFQPLPGPGSSRYWREEDWEREYQERTALLDPMRLAASLLFPIDDKDVNTLLNTITRANGESFAVAAVSEGEMEL